VIRGGGFEVRFGAAMVSTELRNEASGHSPTDPSTAGAPQVYWRMKGMTLRL
jgi:hypothetical protein